MSKEQVFPKAVTPTVHQASEAFVRSAMQTAARALREAEATLEGEPVNDLIFAAWLELAAHSLNSALPYAGRLRRRP